jgi:hypothetical protein
LLYFNIFLDLLVSFLTLILSSGNPAWGGTDSIYNPYYANYIGGIRNNGGDVIVSFGGAGGECFGTSVLGLGLGLGRVFKLIF